MKVTKHVRQGEAVYTVTVTEADFKRWKNSSSIDPEIARILEALDRIVFENPKKP